MANPCRDLAPGQPRANSDGIWRPSPATKPAFSDARGSCASSCPLAAEKSPGIQRRAKRQRRHSIPIARHHLSGGLAQRDLLTTGRGATPSRAAAWARRARQSKDSLHLHMSQLCACAQKLVAPAPMAASCRGRRSLRIVTAFAGISTASPAPCSGPSWCRAPPAVRVPSPSSPGRPRHIDASLSCSRDRATRRSR